MQHLQSSPGEEVCGVGKAALLPKCLGFPISNIRIRKYPSWCDLHMESATGGLQIAVASAMLKTDVV